MKTEDIIIVAESNKEYLETIRKVLSRTGISNQIIHPTNGKEILDLLFDKDKKRSKQEYILLLEISIPEFDPFVVLKKIKQDEKLRRTPVIILTAVDDQDIIDRCHNLGCSTYIVKPNKRQDFEKTIQIIGCFLSIVKTASIK